MAQTVTAQTNTSFQQSTAEQNESTIPEGCTRFVFKEREFLPWDNPDNIVSQEVETAVRHANIVLMWLLFLIGGPLNIINMAVFYKQGIRNRVNLCLFVLSLTDGLQLFNFVLHHGEQIHIQFTTEEPWGPMAIFLSNNNLGFLLGFHYVSNVLSAIIATERFLCVFCPLKVQTLLTTKTMLIIIIVVYVVVMGLFVLEVTRYRVGCLYDPVTDSKVITAVEGAFYRAHKDIIDPLGSFVFGAGLPGLVTFVVTITTVLTIVKLRRAVRWRSETTSSAISEAELAVTRMLVANSIFFLACLIPVAVIRFSWLFFPEVHSGRRNHNFFLMGNWTYQIFTYINSTFNFFVYYAMGTRYRQTFWELFGRKPQQDKKTES